MPAAPNVAQSETVHRSVWLRLLPGSRATAYRLAGTAGACRRVWNYFLDRTQQEYAAYQSGARAEAPSLTFFSLGKEFTALRRDREYAWLQEYSFAAVRHSLKNPGGGPHRLLSGAAGPPHLQAQACPPGWVHHPR